MLKDLKKSSNDIYIYMKIKIYVHVQKIVEFNFY